jgi:putative endonuclease
MGYCCYILYSPRLDKYYIGETEDIVERLNQHNSGFFKNSYTSKSSDWVVFFSIVCINRKQARCVEGHIKSMKSRKYIENLKKTPSISEKLKGRYAQ